MSIVLRHSQLVNRMKGLMRLMFCLLALCFFYAFAEPLKMEVHGKSAILMNAETGRILFEKNPHLPCFPASTTKIATALFAIEGKGIDLSSFVNVTSDALKMKPSKRELADFSFPSHWLESDGTTFGLQKGEKLPLSTILHVLLLLSANDAANVLGEAASGSVPQFMKEMNEYVQNLGCAKTKFMNPHGLHHPEHQTTAYDLAFLMRKGLQNDLFREFLGKQKAIIPGTNKRGSKEIHHTNRLLKSGKHYYSKAIGGKTGFHSAAQYTLAAAATHMGRTLIAVTFGCAKSDDRYVDVRGLFEAAFNEVKIDRIVIPSRQVYVLSLEGGKTPMKAALNRDLYVSYYPAEEPVLKGFIEWDSLTLPIQKGAKVGIVRVVDEMGVSVSVGDLIALENVEKTFLFAIKDKFAKLFNFPHK